MAPPEVTPGAHAPLTGFVRIEEDGRGGSDPRRKRKLQGASKPSASASAKNKRWLYGVLLPGRLQLYARRTEYKRRTPPCGEIVLQIKPTNPNESVFGFDHECVYVRAQGESRVITVRIHQKKDIVRWVTALYYQSFTPKSPLSANVQPEGEEKEDKRRENAHVDAIALRSKRKSVSFQDEPEVLMLPRQSYDPADLFYSEQEYEQFQQHGDPNSDEHERSAASSSSSKTLSRLMKSIYEKTAAKLKVSPKKNMARLR
uniref:Uncharacterized protein n=1 Tax=Globisporangium ultimum (strain ATCC 200006 / CBS 805.95 / DAOM BR144) TaxID=431595 RepID=K3WTT6_GLOUD